MAAMDLIPKLDIRRSQHLTPQEREISDACLRKEVARRPWYHRMDLGNGIVTPGFPWEALWDNIRVVRGETNYLNQSVLDLGSWDGMWAFEAEMLGAAVVVATDCMNYWQIPWQQGMNNLLLVREALFSEVIPLWNVAPTALRDRLDGILYSHPRLKDGFDIVQHLGLLYHLRDPLLSLAQARSVLRDHGTLLLETAIHGADTACAMHFNAGGKAIYDDFTTWWAPTLPCLREMLRVSLFEIDTERLLAAGDTTSPIQRVVVRARAVPPRMAVGERYLLDPAFGHGFGAHLIGRVPYNDPASPDSLEAYYEQRFPNRERLR
jgi:tRNA (mo5U34)-methyltransferase